MQPKARGRIPTWCSPACRQRVWAQSRAAASGRSAVRIDERRVEVPTRAPLTRRDWISALHERAHQLDAVLEAYSRRHYVRTRAAEER